MIEYSAINGLPTVMIIRHAEKPGIRSEPPMGFDEIGRMDLHSLTIRGWQRAGALVPHFRRRSAGSAVVLPQMIFAAKRSYEGDAKEHLANDQEQQFPVAKEQTADSSDHLGARALQTVLPLAEALKLTDSLENYGLTQEAKLVSDIKSGKCGFGPVLISWEHKKISAIVAELQNSTVTVKWRDDRFDMVWILTPDAKGYVLSAEAQLLLDRDQPIDNDTALCMTNFNAGRLPTKVNAPLPQPSAPVGGIVPT